MADELPPELEGFSSRRREIGEGIAAVERALSAPSGSKLWQPRLVAALQELQRLANAQYDAVTAPDGLFAEVREEHPDLVPQTEQIMADFKAALGELEKLIPRAAELSPIELRRRALDLLGSAFELRQRIADLLWDAYWVDVGGPG